MDERWEFFKLEDSSEENLDEIGELLSNDPGMNVHVSIYQDDDMGMANGKMGRIKNYIANKYQVDSDRIHTSWFRFLEKEAVY